MDKQSVQILTKAFKQYSKEDLHIRQLTARCTNAFKFRIGDALKVEIDKHPKKYRNHKIAYADMSMYCRKHYDINQSHGWFERCYYSTKLQDETKEKILKECIAVKKVDTLVTKKLDNIIELEEAYLNGANIFPDKKQNGRKPEGGNLNHGNIDKEPAAGAVTLPYPFDEDICIDRLANYFTMVSGKDNGKRVIDQVIKKLG